MHVKYETFISDGSNVISKVKVSSAYHTKQIDWTLFFVIEAPEFHSRP